LSYGKREDREKELGENEVHSLDERSSLYGNVLKNGLVLQHTKYS